MTRPLILKDAIESDYQDLLKTIRTACGTEEGQYILWNDLTEQELEILSSEYFAGSRYKRLSSMSAMAYESSPSTFLSVMSTDIALRFGDSFRRVYETYFQGEYNPLHNYDMEEKRSPDLTFETDGDQDFKTTTTSEGKEYGFNSDEGVPVSEATTTSEGDKAENKNHSKTTHKGSETLTRAGNIGVMSTQNLIDQEKALRKFDFWKWVFDTIDLVLVRNYFSF